MAGPVFIGLGCLGAAIGTLVYGDGCNYYREAKVLESVPRVNHIKDLAQLIDSTESKILPIVTFSGRVGTDQTPIFCEDTGLKGVMMSKRVELHYKYKHWKEHPDVKLSEDGKVELPDTLKNKTFFVQIEPHTERKKIVEECWKEDYEILMSKEEEVPWYLDDGTGRATVVNPQRASGFGFTVRNVEFDDHSARLGITIKDQLFDKLEILKQNPGLKVLGVKSIERVLPVGTSFTVIGKAVKDDSGAILVQEPSEGPFYVSGKTVDQLIEYLEGSGGIRKSFSAVIIIISVLMIAAGGITEDMAN